MTRDMPDQTQQLQKEISLLKRTIRKLEKADSEKRRARKALLESEKKYRFITEKMTDIVWIQDMQLRTVYVSPSIMPSLGFTPEERIAQDVSEQLTPSSLSLAFHILAEELTREEEGTSDPERKINLELEYYHKDGSIRWFENMISGIRDEQGTLTGIHGVSRDITKRKRAEEELKRSEEQQRLIIEKLPISVFIGVRDKIVFVNEVFLQLFKLSSRDEILGKRLTDFIPSELFDGIQKVQRITAQQHVDLSPMEVNIQRRDGGVITVVVTPMVINFYGQIAILGSIIDITERKLKEIELQKAHRLLQLQNTELETLRTKLSVAQQRRIL